MPHPDANIADAATLDAAFAHLLAIQQRRQLWTILKFDTMDTYFVFHSTQIFTQQMHGIAATIAKAKAKKLAALEENSGREHCFALDTGCVWGKRLSALRLEDEQWFSCVCAE